MTRRDDYCSFLVRMWRQPPASASHGPPEHAKPGAAVAEVTWLLQIEHIPSGEKQYLSSLEELFAFMRGIAGERDPQSVIRET